MNAGNKKQGLDPRVRRTRRYLTEALLDLAAERDFRDITVMDISNAADVNRNTFYLHFRDKQDLIDQTLDALFHEITDEIRQYVEENKQPNPEIVPRPLIAMVQAFAKRPRLYLRLLQSSGSYSLADRLTMFHIEEFLQVWANMRSEPAEGSLPASLRAVVAARTIDGAIVWWLESGLEDSDEAIAAWIWSVNRPLFFDNLES